MQFKDQNESAHLLTDRIKQENLSDIFLTYINPDAKEYCQLISANLNTTLTLLETSISSRSDINPNHILILDDGSTRVGEYQEFVDYLRKHYPKTNLIIAVPFIPQSEEDQFHQMSDSLITLYVETLFFSISQFYSQS